MAQRRNVTSNNTVTVASKLPHGLIMRIFDFVEAPVPVMGGGTRMEKVAQPREETVVLNGCAHPQNKAPTAQIVGGFALTYNVDEQFWERWLDQNKTSMMVKNGLIFAHHDANSTMDQAEDHASIRSGLERLDPKKLPKGLEIADEMKGRSVA